MTLIWYACRTAIRGEERARMALEALGDLVVYLPREPFWRGRGPAKERAERPLLARHLFVAVQQGQNRFPEICRAHSVERILRPSPEHAYSEVPRRALAIIQTVEGEITDDFDRKAARKRKYGDDTDEFIERLKAAPPEKRAEEILAMLGRGAKARLKLETLRDIA